MNKLFISQNISRAADVNTRNYCVFTNVLAGPSEAFTWNNWKLSPIGTIPDANIQVFDFELSYNGGELFINKISTLNGDKLIYMHVNPKLISPTNNVIVQSSNPTINRSYYAPIDNDGNVDICLAYTGTPNYNTESIAAANWMSNTSSNQYLHLTTPDSWLIGFDTSVNVTPGKLIMRLNTMASEDVFRNWGSASMTNPSAATGSAGLTWVSMDTIEWEIGKYDLVSYKNVASTIQCRNSGTGYCTGTLTASQKEIILNGYDVTIQLTY